MTGGGRGFCNPYGAAYGMGGYRPYGYGPAMPYGGYGYGQVARRWCDQGHLRRAAQFVLNFRAGQNGLGNRLRNGCNRPKR